MAKCNNVNVLQKAAISFLGVLNRIEKKIIFYYTKIYAFIFLFKSIFLLKVNYVNHQTKVSQAFDAAKKYPLRISLFKLIGLNITCQWHD